MGHKNWALKNRDTIYAAQTPDEISFVRDRISLPSGHEFNYVYVDCPYEVVYVIGVNDRQEILVINQYRYLLGENVFEVPAGSPEGEESLEAGALREFEEEAGYIAKSIRKLTSFYPSSGITNQKCHIFLASNLEESNQNLEESEEITVSWMHIDKAISMVHQGAIENVGAALGIVLAERIIKNSNDS